MTTLLREDSAPSIDATPTFESEVLVHLPALLRKARHLTNHVQDAEDLVQETMLKAFRFSHTYQTGTNMRAWLFRILNTSAINHYRRKALSPTLSSLPEGEEFYLSHQIWDLSGRDRSEGAEEVVLNHSLDEDVYRALNDLPPNFRTAVILADIEDFSYKEIAEALQIPIGTVMSRISRARHLLQKSLRHYAREQGYIQRSS